MGRVVSANENNFNGPSAVLDLQGFDYSTEDYDLWHQQAPHIPAISSETSSAVSDRGEYANDPKGGHVRGYDTEAPSWGQTAEMAWQAILSRPFISGGFTWTGWDYRGEPTPYQWPDVNSHFGILDAAGFWKDRTHWYQSCWERPGAKPTLHIMPHWNWQVSTCRGSCGLDAVSRDGMSIEVWVYSSADEVELIHPNGTSLGRRNSTRCSHVAWDVVYQPGALSARAFRNVQHVASAVIETTGPPVALRALIKDGVGANGIVAGSDDVALVQVEVVDAVGRVVPNASDVVTFAAVGGGAAVLGTANGDPACQVANILPTRPAFHGLVMAVVRAGEGPGPIHVRVSAPGLIGGYVRLEALPEGSGSNSQASALWM